MRAVFRHELSGYFTTPVGYVFLTMYALLSGLVFVFINIGQEMSASRWRCWPCWSASVRRKSGT